MNHPNPGVLPEQSNSESVFFEIRAAEKLVAEAKFYLGLDTTLALNLLVAAQERLEGVLGYARAWQQDTARIERVLSEIEHLGGRRPALV